MILVFLADPFPLGGVPLIPLVAPPFDRGGAEPLRVVIARFGAALDFVTALLSRSSYGSLYSYDIYSVTILHSQRRLHTMAITAVRTKARAKIRRRSMLE